jgi:hypothetical protein
LKDEGGRMRDDEEEIHPSSHILSRGGKGGFDYIQSRILNNS